MKNKKSILRGGIKYKKWEVINKLPITNPQLQIKQIVDLLMKNRGITTEKKMKEFFFPVSPDKLNLKDFKINKLQVDRVISRLKEAKGKEKIVIYGDYDADGICATAVLWETLYALGFDVLPHIPERFSEGYGINLESVKKLKSEYADLGLIITVDNGIVAVSDIKQIQKDGIDVIVTDHHAKTNKLPDAYAIVHTTQISGSAIAWVVSREVLRKIKPQEPKNLQSYGDGLDLAVIGLIADQIPLTGVARSFAKHGLAALKLTNRVGLLSLYRVAGVNRGDVGIYEVNFMIAPRINAMGRMQHAIESLRLLCTRSIKKANELALTLNNTNMERQKMVDDVVMHAKSFVEKDFDNKVIILAHESYHEGVIGLAASKLVEEFYRPVIVISKSVDLAKGSARSVAGFNIIEAIRKVDYLIEGGGGHPMAAGFTLKTKNLDTFINKFRVMANPFLSEEIMTKKLKIDTEITFSQISKQLLSEIAKFEPTGIGNPQPVFISKGVKILDTRLVGRGEKHLKIRCEENNIIIDAIAFNFSQVYADLVKGTEADVVYSVENNIWNGYESLQIKIKDLRIN